MTPSKAERTTFAPHRWQWSVMTRFEGEKRAMRRGTFDSKKAAIELAEARLTLNAKVEAQWIETRPVGRWERV